MAVVLEGEVLVELAARDGVEQATDLQRWRSHVIEQLVDRAEHGGPLAAQRAGRRPLADPPRPADGALDAAQLADGCLVRLDDGVERRRNLARQLVAPDRQADVEVAPPDGPEGGEQLQIGWVPRRNRQRAVRRLAGDGRVGEDLIERGHAGRCDGHLCSIRGGHGPATWFDELSYSRGGRPMQRPLQSRSGHCGCNTNVAGAHHPRAADKVPRPLAILRR